VNEGDHLLGLGIDGKVILKSSVPKKENGRMWADGFRLGDCCWVFVNPVMNLWVP
jgi:hypothetical protein